MENLQYVLAVLLLHETEAEPRLSVMCLIHNDVTKTKWLLYLGEICINIMETSNETVLLDSCDLLNLQGTGITSLITLKKVFRHI